MTEVDRVIPPSPSWMFVYAAIYPITIIPAVVLRDRSLLRRVGVAHLVAQSVAFAAFFLMPVSGAELRPVHVPTDTLSGWALALNYRIDPPLNCFPSLHVTTTTLTAIVLARVSRPLGWLGATVAALIAISTLFVKQHYLLDVVGGGLLGAVVAATMLGSRRDSSPFGARRRSSVFGFVAFIALYAAMLGGAYRAYRARRDPVAEGRCPLVEHPRPRAVDFTRVAAPQSVGIRDAAPVR
jgi:membrane-associated phospholipid phosphatase